MNLDRNELLAPLLQTDVRQFRTRFQDKVVHAAGKPMMGAVRRDEMFQEGNLAVFFRDNQRMRKYGSALSFHQMEYLEGCNDLDVLRNDQNGTGAKCGFVKCRKFFGAQLRGLSHKMLFQQR